MKTLNDLFKMCLGARYITNNADADYAVEVNGETLYVFFQWSRGCEDWRNNLDFRAAPYVSDNERWYVHRGFLRVWESMNGAILNTVAHFLGSVRGIGSLIIVGYSHGAPLAALATERFISIYGKTLVIKGFGFGCPRYVFGKLPSKVSERLKSFLPVICVPDIVARLPPMLFGYSYGTVPLFLGKNMNYRAVEAHRAETYLTETAKLGRMITR